MYSAGDAKRARGSGRPGIEGEEQGVERREVIRAAGDRNRGAAAAIIAACSSIYSEVADTQVQAQVLEQSVHGGYGRRRRVRILNPVESVNLIDSVDVPLPPEEAQNRPQLSQGEVGVERVKGWEPPCSSGEAGVAEAHPPTGELPDRLDLNVGQFLHGRRQRRHGRQRVSTGSEALGCLHGSGFQQYSKQLLKLG